MSVSVEQANAKSSQYTVIGWLAGVAYFVWYQSIDLSIQGHVILVAGGGFISSIIIGGGMALVSGALTRVFTGSWSGSHHGYAWGAFIAPVIAFFCVEPVANTLTQLL